jgi:hypothetical protein
MKLARTAAAIGLVLALAAPASAVDAYDDGQAHPLRLAAYILHPIGFLSEWLVTRPLHRIFSQDDLESISGHVPHQGFDYENYTEGLSTGVSYEEPYQPMLERAE